nr:MAG TPA: hypothetical protein [Caudoviricetes sp.]
MKEFRRISGTKVRQACVNHNWFTCGVINDYDAFLEYIYGCSYEGRNIDTGSLEFIANKIKKHSDTEYDIPQIMFTLNAECCTIYFE